MRMENRRLEYYARGSEKVRVLGGDRGSVENREGQTRRNRSWRREIFETNKKAEPSKPMSYGLESPAHPRNAREFVLESRRAGCARSGGRSGVSGFAGVCAEAREGRGVAARSRGSGPGAGDFGSRAAGVPSGDARKRLHSRETARGKAAGSAECGAAV